LGEVGVGGDFDATKGALKQAACALVGVVDSLGVGVEKVGERLAWILRTLLDAYQQVKMIAHQTVGKRIGYGLDMISIELHKIGVVARFAKQVLTVVAAVIDMVITARE